MHALPKDIAKYEEKYDEGYTQVYEARLKKMKSLGLLSPDWEIPGPVGQWPEVKLKEWEAACMEVYAAMVDNMDQGIGRIVTCLKDNKQLDNTLIIYVQDNGGCAEGMGRGKQVGPLERPAQPDTEPMKRDELQTQMISPKVPRRLFPAPGSRGHARTTRNLHRLWSQLGQRVQHPFPYNLPVILVILVLWACSVREQFSTYLR